MRAYGLPRVDDVEFPDKGDIRGFALASHVGFLFRESGEYRGLVKNKQEKRNTRRIYKRSERSFAKRFIKEVLEDV